ncbi:helix-turn-helix domain-containing protein [Pseudoflavonifractor phocaeensis]|uniref:helix-turn-helix domain-containing protein n=1 Tax=Pseudoflavonifractor phocaeensis TaxID=1870988 RepID=UPI001958BC8B|nr:helix-turn-helix transcriptional regulator [Pseudoflavonifractor phocaeensis]MBM6926628.1 helix-turn-helix transcriptional regulator [Pseudoflavonifractor phocaeensis]
MEFCQRLREIRNAKEKKQREVAEYLNVNIRTYQLYEEGKNEPSIQKLIALADYFQVTLDQLVGRADW